MSRILKENDIKEIIVGAAFLGAGGGGGLDDGLIMLEENISKTPGFEVTLISPEELADNSNAVMIAGLGSPQALKEKEDKFLNETRYAFESMEHSAFLAGKHIDAIIPVEIGSVNTFVPMIPCATKGIPLVDADGCGRAVPGMDTTLYSIGGIPFSPGVATSDDGDIIYVLPADPLDYAEAENMLRYLCGAYGFCIGLGGCMSSKGDILAKLVPGTVSLQQKAGKAILEARAAGKDVEDALGEAITLRKLASGIVEANEQITKNGHDVGLITIKGDDGKTYYADVKNETIAFRTDDETLLTCPDLICCIDVKTCTPLTNAAIEAGMNVAYFAVPAADIWFADTEGTAAAWKPYFEAVGYSGDIVRY
ncbi:MAG: DUF917 domain-containing protein [Clostridiales Family XIII bacterium]|nr:DUF917 domain-containing protein [Clostridiales Family XIII bacterium]